MCYLNLENNHNQNTNKKTWVLNDEDITLLDLKINAADGDDKIDEISLDVDHQFVSLSFFLLLFLVFPFVFISFSLLLTNKNNLSIFRGDYGGGITGVK